MEVVGRSPGHSGWKLSEDLLAPWKVHGRWRKVSLRHVKLTEVDGRSRNGMESLQKLKECPLDAQKVDRC